MLSPVSVKRGMGAIWAAAEAARAKRAKGTANLMVFPPGRLKL